MNNMEKSSVGFILFSASYSVYCGVIFSSQCPSHLSTITPRRKEYARKTSECYLTYNIPYELDELDFKVVKVPR